MHQQFQPRGVVFFGLSAADKDHTQRFIAQQNLPWPNGYGAEATLRLLGSAAPMIYVVGRDGRIAWSDERSQYRHDLKPLEHELSDAIESSLSNTEPDAPQQRF